MRARTGALAVVAVGLLPALAAAADPAVAGRVVDCRGEGFVRHTHSAEGLEEPLVAGKYVHEGDVIRTTTAKARLLMRDNGILDLGPGTQINLRAYQVAMGERRRSVTLKLMAGRLWARVSKAFLGQSADDPSFQVETANAVAGVRGTEFVTDVGADGDMSVTVISGSVALDPQVGEAPTETLGAMTRATVSREGAVATGPVTAGEVSDLRRSVRNDPAAPVTGPGAPPGGADAGAQEPGPGSGGESGEGEGGEGAEAGEQEQPAETPPPENNDLPILDIDPGASRTRVRGRVEVRD